MHFQKITQIQNTNTALKHRHNKTLMPHILIFIIFSIISPLDVWGGPVHAHGDEDTSHDSSLHTEETHSDATSSPDKSRTSVRFYKEAPGSLTSSDSEDNEDDEDLETWLENTRASNNNSLNGPVDDSYIQKTLTKMIDNPAIIPVLIRSTAKPSGRVSYQYHFEIQSLPLHHTNIKAIKMHNDNIVIVGDIPASTYDPDHFKETAIENYDTKDKTLKEIMSSTLAQHDASFDAEKLSLEGRHACVLTLDDHYVPGICAQFLYNYLYYEATFHHLGLASYNPLVSHAKHTCALLKDIHTFNPKTKKTDFAVEVCSQRSAKNALANQFIVAGTETCGATSSSELAATDTKKSTTTSILESLLPSYAASNSNKKKSVGKPTGHFQPTALAFNDGKFTHKDDLSSRQAHVFSYTSRMHEWFASLGFKSPYPDPIYLVVHTDNTNNWIQAGNAFYSFSPTGDDKKRKNIIGFGRDNKTLQNLAYDFDISAHELAHYVNGHYIRGRLQRQSGHIMFSRKRYSDNYPSADHTTAINEGLADYFTFAATENSCLGETMNVAPKKKVSISDKNCLRTANPPFTYQGTENYTTTSGTTENIYVSLLQKNSFHSLGQLLFRHAMDCQKKPQK